MTVMGNDSQMNGGREIKKRWSLKCGPRVWVVLLAIVVIHVGASKSKTISSDMRITSRRSNITIGERVCNTPECYQVAKFVNDSINYTVDPCDDFYHYACGRWSENHPIPIGESSYDVRSEILDKIDLTKRRILEAGISDINGVSRDVIKIPYDVYHSCMNTTAIENLGDASLKNLIQEFGNWTMVEENGDWNESNWDLAQVLAAIHRGYSSKSYSLFNVELIRNPNNRSRFAIRIDQAAMPIPMQSYVDSGWTNWEKGVYVDFVTLLGGKINISKKVQDVVDFEAKLANISVRYEDKITQEMTIRELQVEAPNFQWLNHLNSVFAPERLNENETIYVRSLPYVKKLMAIVLQTPKSVLANYLVTTLVWDEKDFLPKRQQNQTKHQKSCLKFATSELAEDIFGALYIHDNLDKYVQIKEKVKLLAAEIHKGFKENVKSLSWLDITTKNAVIEKNDFMADLLMFPDYYLNGTHLAKILDKYNGIVTRDDTFHSNAIALKKANHRSYLRNLRRTIDGRDRLELLWEEDIDTASFLPTYSFTYNRMHIPAGLVQTPVYYERDNDYLRSINLGSLGCYIGHEITHGFGKLGGSYDKYGMKTSTLWTPTSTAAVMGKVGCIINQYSKYKINGKYPINFQRTLEEDIADNGALKAALKAYYDWSKKNPNDTWRLPGLNFTNEQLFFFGFARNMCTNINLKQRLKALRRSPHSDPQFRANGVLSNSLEFANAFNCRQNSPMNPANKCALWSKVGSLAN